MLKTLPITVRHIDLDGLLVRAVSRVYDWQARYEERRHLAGLDERLLKDIGLTRSQVASEIRKPFWQA